jgi:hypothetical protein
MRTDRLSQDSVLAAGSDSEEVRALRLALAKREWLLEMLERQRDLAPAITGIPRRANLSADEFLERYYAANRPVILTGEMQDWPALSLWSSSYLKGKVGARQIEFQGDRTYNRNFEEDKETHLRSGAFDAFMDRIMRPGAGNDAYITAYNSARNEEALKVLQPDLGFADKFLSRDVAPANGMMWIGPAGTVTSLHHDLSNNLIAQVVGRKRFRVLPASEVGRLYNSRHVFSDVPDLGAPDIDLRTYPRLVNTRCYDVVLSPGEMIFIPIAWWHQVNALDFSVSVTYTNFRWPNYGARGYPRD